MSSDVRLRTMNTEDRVAVKRIYEEGITTGSATFETTVPTYAQWDDAHVESCRIVAEWDGTLPDWAALSPVSSRCV